MKKSDLRTGMRVVLFTGDIYTVMLNAMGGEDILLGADEWLDLSKLDNNFKSIISGKPYFAKIYKGSYVGLREIGYLLWEYKKEVEEMTMDQVIKELGREIKIVK